MDDWINEGMNECVNEWMNGWVNEWMNEWMNERVNEWMNVWMNEWMDEWMSERMDEWNHWTNESINALIDMKELKHMRWSEWIEMNVLTCMSWNEWIDMNKKGMTGTEWIDMDDLKLRKRNNQWIDKKWVDMNILTWRNGQSDRKPWIYVFMWHRALATISCAFCRPHLPKVFRDPQSFIIWCSLQLDEDVVDIWNRALSIVWCTFANLIF